MMISPMSGSPATRRRKSGRFTRTMRRVGAGAPAHQDGAVVEEVELAGELPRVMGREDVRLAVLVRSKISIEPSMTRKKSTLRSPRAKRIVPAGDALFRAVARDARCHVVREMRERLLQPLHRIGRVDRGLFGGGLVDVRLGHGHLVRAGASTRRHRLKVARPITARLWREQASRYRASASFRLSVFLKAGFG